MKILTNNPRKISCLLLIIIITDILSPLSSYALTGGPSQPEVQTFSPVSSSDMVDLFTGDFSYNIPLLDIDGYPINLSYNGGITMDQEASWVGLGWNLNPGVINRNMRGLPDDFKGDEVKSTLKMKTNATYNVGVGFRPELYGFNKENGPLGLGINVGLHYNNYRGLGLDFGLSPSIGTSGLNAGLALNFSSSDGFSSDLNLSADINSENKDNETNEGIGISASTGYNSRSGMKTLNYGLNMSSSKKTYPHADEKKKILGRAHTASSSAELMGNNLTFGTQTHSPSISGNSKTGGLSLSFGWGAEIFGVFTKISVNGSVNTTRFDGDEIPKPSYGYLFSEKKTNSDVLLDFNREKDGPFIETSENLPLPIATYDMFSVSGQGVGGTFRAYRNDFPMFHDDERKENFTRKGEKKKLIQSALGLEVGATTTTKLGVNISMIFNKSYSGKWVTENSLKNKFDFLETANDNDPTFEPSYFKMLGELSPLKSSTVDKVGTKNLVSPLTGLNMLSSNIKKYSTINNTTKTSFIGNNDAAGKVHYTGREKRNQLISFLNANDATIGGLDKEINLLIMNQGIEPVTMQRVGEYRKAHHISEVTVTSQGGERFVYGIPVYNNKHIEKTFAITPLSGSADIVPETGQVFYEAGDNTTSNAKGVDNYYSSKETPPYSHSFLLTGVLSADYVDVKNDGITDDDLGSATKFTYCMPNSNFKWRIPYKKNSANYFEGNKSTTLDDKGSYIYGEKEIWHLRTVEGKNHIAIFELQRRHDAMGVKEENGDTIHSMCSYALKKITLYAKQDYLLNGSAAYPIKTVNFVYDYSLCPNVENNDCKSEPGPGGSNLNASKGKLTLKSVYFTYGTSHKGRLSPYVFAYSDLNPAYNLKGCDRWGNFKPSRGNNGLTGLPNNAEYPYTIQNKDSSDLYASAWSLDQITLPSGGKIQITYEADDYAYVQDRKAMHMFEIEGFSSSHNGSKSTNQYLFDINTKSINPKKYVYFKLDKQITGTNKNEVFRQQYLGDLRTVQFDLLALVSNKRYESYEFVKVYADVDVSLSGVTDDGLSGYLYLNPKSILSKKEGSNNADKVCPLAKGVWQFIRSQVPHQLYPFSDKNRKYDESKGRKIFAGMASAFSKISKIFSGGLEKYMYKQGYGSKVKLNKSWVRLNDPDGFKYGGGHRVKKITMNDDWANMSQDKGVENQTYGQEYLYETRDTITNTSISSGVAAYEPGIGADENPFRMPKTTIEVLKLAPDNLYTTDEPLGESYSPAPIVGYSEIRTTPLIPSGIVMQQTGYSVNTYYTAKEFPFKVYQTLIEKAKIKPKFGVPFAKKVYHTTVSQGYLIETNDMHGKPRSELIYNRHRKVVSGSSYVYSIDKNSPDKLDNKVKTIKNDGTLSDQELGVTVDFFSDVRESKSNTLNVQGQYNTDIFGMGPIVVPILMFFCIPKQEDKIFQSAVIVKHVNRMGLIKKTYAYQEGGAILTENLLYDNETGDVLMTSVQNEFEDNLYNFTYPAHWAYDKGMGQAYKNTGLVLNSITFDGSIPKISGSNLNNYLVNGDECILYDNDENTGTLVYAYLGADGIINLIDSYGQPVSNAETNKLKVIRSGRRNMQNIPIGSITTLKNPIKTGTLQFDSILNSSASEYNDKWKVYCNQINTTEWSYDSTYRDFFIGLYRTLGIGWDTRYAYSSIGQRTIESVNADSIYDNSVFFKNFFVDSCYAKALRDDDTSEYFTGSTSNSLLIRAIGLGSEWNDLLSGIDINTQAGKSISNAFEVSILFNWHLCNCNSIPMKFYLFSETPISYSRITGFTNITPYLSEEISGSPGLGHQFRMKAIIDGDMEVEMIGYNSCKELYQNCHPYCSIVANQNPINPFKAGIRGNWRKVTDYAFSADRKYQSSQVSPRRDATYKSDQYTNFWKKDSTTNAQTGSYFKADVTNNKWVWTNQVTLYSPYGPELENKNALNIYSSAIYGFKHTLPLAVASNARFRQIGFESFEDESSLIDCEVGHFSFIKNLGEDAILSKKVKHSGKTSLKVKANHTYTNEIIFEDTTPEEFNKEEDSYYQKSKTDCIGTFQPDSGYYILGAWVKDSVSVTDTTYSNPEITVEVVKSGVTTAYHFKASGLIIEGWQRIEGRFKIPDGATIVRFKLKSSTENVSWFDDIRVHPVSGNMKSYAYDPVSLRLMADMDENNYASFYEYDLEGNLARLKRETERGIVTIKETRSSIKGAK
jgi:hypothetical protein